MSTPSCPRNSCLLIPKANREAAGVYQCKATNGVGASAKATVTLEVECKLHIKISNYLTDLLSPDSPSITCNKNTRPEFNSGVTIACQVHGVPTPTVHWEKGEVRIKTGHTNQLTQMGDEFSLILVKLNNSSFGNYSCVARNNHGTSRYDQVHVISMILFNLSGNTLKFMVGLQTFNF